MRKDPLITGEVYHVFSRSIADYIIFNNNFDYERMWQLIQYYKINNNNIRYSDFINFQIVNNDGFYNAFNLIKKDKKNSVQIIAYCFMPTHIHLVLKQLQDKGISQYMKHILDSYSKYFNFQHKRRGPLWESRFKSILVKKDEYLMHLTRYIHLNPVTAKIIDKPKEWQYSSFNEYLGTNSNIAICQFNDILEINSSQYRKFTNDRISYQRDLAKIKKLILD
ncbi:MAG: hypothetical protein US31_C0001G0067 [Berkelbacteria bacterium GW2011_GWA1_36_9]|uniref:Transposase IS200-like domain-containing protein n=1 Tax=Berkelbacteria bacterium GW2011_GWA1_36_9 TaxID=1618331 RepID=A0A0G0FYM1_9BACT|nr:MAG: hypothetical protein US31_C0001G0067 [Berkelbacteria bacterium GW2011_GWA1_36_9]